MGMCADDPLFALIRFPIDLRSNDADLNSLLSIVRDAEIKTGKKCVWLIVDTLARALAGGDENTSGDMGRIVGAADILRTVTEAHFTFTHHTGKDAARGARGHSSLRGATDTEIEIGKSSLVATKQRDGELGFQIGFDLEDIVIAEDPLGRLVKSAVVNWKNIGVAAPAINKAATPKSSRMLLSVVEQAILESEAAPIRPDLDPGKKALHSHALPVILGMLRLTLV
jgi:hypothetical protein